VFVYVDRDGNPELWVWAVLKKGPGGSAYDTDWNAFARKYYRADYGKLDSSDFRPPATAKA
jgi:hypothetical protein